MIPPAAGIIYSGYQDFESGASEVPEFFSQLHKVIHECLNRLDKSSTKEANDSFFGTRSLKRFYLGVKDKYFWIDPNRRGNEEIISTLDCDRF